MLKYIYEILFVVIGLNILVLNFFFIAQSSPAISPLFNIVGGLIAVVPPIWLVYAKYKTKKEIEAQFLVFITDLTQAINSGMTLPLALQSISKRNYLSLSPLISQMAAQVAWGIPFRKALKLFSKKADSIPIGRAIDTIIQTYKIGGKIGETLNAIGESLLTIDKIKKERSASVHSQIVTSYMIYFVFIMILVILQIFLLPALGPTSLPGVASAPTEGISDVYSESFVNFIIVQGFFAGLVTGKMAEGSIIAGLKHSVLLIAVGYTIFTLASQLQISII